jgi:hypothetical protein
MTNVERITLYPDAVHPDVQKVFDIYGVSLAEYNLLQHMRISVMINMTQL